MIPNLLLKRLYTIGSLKSTAAGTQFALKNRLSDADVLHVDRVSIDGTVLPLERVFLQIDSGATLSASEVTPLNPLPFPLRSTVLVQTAGVAIGPGKHEMAVDLETHPFGKLQVRIEDEPSDGNDARLLARSDTDDYDASVIQERRNAIEQSSGVKLRHILHHSFDPHVAKGNCEHFVGVAQVPLGFAGPLRVNGEYAAGEFLIPLATSEGTLVASHNRGIKILNLCGGATTTVSGDAMQRAPVFVFENARACRDFVQWLDDHTPEIRSVAEATSSVAKLLYIDPYSANKFVYLRFNFLTGDAAGQNMVGKATLAACEWVLANYPGISRFYLESNFATDKKSSRINVLKTRGKHVTAEVTIPRAILREHLRVEPEVLTYHYGVANVGAFLSGANSNGLQSANAITAMFIATGQDVANVAESSAAVLYSEMTPEGDFYLSLTLPSLIVATYGGGTGLATQRECLEILDCYGKGKVKKLAEIIAAVALAGEISLGAAISSLDWVASHERHGRNR